MTIKQQSLYDRVGGKEAIASLVDQFYDRVLDDPELEPFFRFTPMESFAPCNWSSSPPPSTALSSTPASRSITSTRRGITTKHLTRFMGHLLMTIREVHPNEQEVDEMIQRISMYANEVLDGAPGGSE